MEGRPTGASHLHFERFSVTFRDRGAWYLALMLPRSLAIVSAALFSAFVGLACEKSEVKTADDANATRDQGPRRMALTRDIIEENHLTAEEVAQLQLYLHGTIRLKRAIYAEAREITPEHTLKVVDGKSLDELVVESGTPGVNIARDGMKINFDPNAGDEGFEFEEGPDGRYRFKYEKSPDGHDAFLQYEGQDYALVDGKNSYLEIDTENLHNILSRERKLPGSKLPPGVESTAPAATPAPSASSSAPTP